MRKYVDNIVQTILIANTVIMLLSVVWQVLSRYFFQIPATFTDEIASFSLIWLGILGAAYASGKNLHLAIDLFSVDYIKKNRLIYDGFVTFCICLFAVTVMIIGGSNLCIITWQLEQKSASLEIPLYLVYMIIPISGILITYYACFNFFNPQKLTDAKS